MTPRKSSADSQSGAGVSASVAQVADRLAAPAMVIRADKTVTYANAAAKRLTPKDAAWIVGGRLKACGALDLDAEEVLLRASDGAPTLARLSKLGESLLIVWLVSATRPTLHPLPSGLTAAEREIALALAGGASPSEIAAARGRSRETVRGQIRAIYAKTGVRRRRDLVRALTAKQAITLT